MIHRGILVRIEDYARRHYRLVFVITLLLVLGSLLLGRGIQLDTDILGMLPRDDGEIGRFVHAIDDFGSLDYLLVMLEVPEGHLVEDHAALADAFAHKLSALHQVDYVEYRLDLNSPSLKMLLEHAPLYLDEDGLDQVAHALTDEEIRTRVARLRSTLRSPLGFFVKSLAKYDPLGMVPIFLSRRLATGSALHVDLSTGTYLSEDGRAQLLIVKPNRPPQNVAFSTKLEASVVRCYEEAKAEVARGKEAAPSLKLGGGYIVAIEDAKLIKSDMKLNAIVSFLGVTGLYLFCYRRVAAIFYSVTPLIVGQALTLGVAVLVMGKISNATAGFTAMLMGLGTDFTIVMYSRYVEERRAGAALATATHRMMGETALGVFTGAITSAGTFGAVCVSRFPGIRDFGFLVACGILICMVAILFLLPAMIAWNEGRRKVAERSVDALYLHSFGFERLLRVSDRFPRAMIAICVVLTLVAGVAATRIEESDSYRDLRSPNNKGFLVQEEIARRFGASFRYLIVVCHGASVEEALQRSATVAKRLDPYVDSGDLAGYDSLRTYLPDETQQRRALQRIGGGAEGPFSADRVTRTLRAALVDNGFREDAFEGAIQALDRQLRSRDLLTLEDLKGAGIGKLVDRYVKHVSGEYRTAIFLFPRSQAFRDRIPDEFLHSVRGGDPKVDVTGLSIVGVTVKRMFREDARRAFLIGLVLVTVLLYLDFRSVRLTIYGMAQLVVGVVWLLGIMKLFHIQMNFINAFATTMILGVGIDYGIHLIHRIWEEGSLVSRGVLETGKAVVMAALTNIAGFGTVALSGYPGMHSMGLVSLFGTATCLVTALTLLPALLKLYPESRRAPPPLD